MSLLDYQQAREAFRKEPCRDTALCLFAHMKRIYQQGLLDRSNYDEVMILISRYLEINLVVPPHSPGH